MNYKPVLMQALFSQNGVENVAKNKIQMFSAPKIIIIHHNAESLGIGSQLQLQQSSLHKSRKFKLIAVEC